MHNTTNENEFNWNPGHSDVVQYLIKKGANIEAQNRRKLTALHYSALSGNEQNQMTKITYINIEIKLKLNWNLGKLDVTKCLLDNGAEIEAKDDQERTPLHHSSEYGI